VYLIYNNQKRNNKLFIFLKIKSLSFSFKFVFNDNLRKLDLSKQWTIKIQLEDLNIKLNILNLTRAGMFYFGLMFKKNI